MIFRIPAHRINWKTSVFLIGTFILTLTAVPAYLWHYGLDWFQVTLFFAMFIFTGLSITLGYHRLFSHLAFKAHWSVRLFTLIFGAAAFENSALMWSSEHRRHHKYVDHEEDPYDITKGFFHAHIGWLLFKLKVEPPFDNVVDLQNDPLVRIQHRFIHAIAFAVCFILPATLGWIWNGAQGALGGFLLAGVARVVCLQHCTFCINSACHTVGNRPYSSRCTARDSWIMALVTFGEGYHNYHHEFQHDYRNGVKPWQFDPTKWTIWCLSKLGLTGQLRRVPTENILFAELRETQRTLQTRLSTVSEEHAHHGLLLTMHDRLQSLLAEGEQYRAKKMEVSREMLARVREELKSAMRQIKSFDMDPVSVA